jgi:hypothetical protein
VNSIMKFLTESKWKLLGLKEIGTLYKNKKKMTIFYEILCFSKWKLLGLKQIGTLDKNKKVNIIVKFYVFRNENFWD